MAQSSNSQTRKRCRKDTDDQEWEVEGILASRSFCSRIQYQVKWKEWDTDLTWYNGGGFEHAARLLQEFHQRHPEQPGPPKRLERWLRSANPKSLLAIGTSKKRRNEKSDNSEVRGPRTMKDEKEGFHGQVKGIDKAGEGRNGESNVLPKQQTSEFDQENPEERKESSEGGISPDWCGEDEMNSIDLEDCESEILHEEVAQAPASLLQDEANTSEDETEELNIVPDGNQPFDEDSHLEAPQDAAEHEKTESKSFQYVSFDEENAGTRETPSEEPGIPTKTTPSVGQESMQPENSEIKNTVEESYLHRNNITHLIGRDPPDLRHSASVTHYGPEGHSTADSRLEYNEEDGTVHVYIQPDQLDEYLLGEGLATTACRHVSGRSQSTWRTRGFTLMRATTFASEEFSSEAVTNQFGIRCH